MKKLLFQFDTDIYPSAFDTIVAYDGGADHVISYGELTPDNVVSQVEGTIFTRAPKDKKYTAIFVGGSNLADGEKLFAAVQKKFISDYGFQVSIMLDSNGCNTTAAAGVAKLSKSSPLSGKKAVVLAGTGPVGQRAAVMLAKSGAQVAITSRNTSRAENACAAMHARFGVKLQPLTAVTQTDRSQAIADANIVFACGAAGIELISATHWEENNNIELMADANATPPLGIGGTEMYDKGAQRKGKIIWGAIGFGTLKLALHRACIEQLFTSNDQILDAEEIFSLAQKMA